MIDSFFFFGNFVEGKSLHSDQQHAAKSSSCFNYKGGLVTKLKKKINHQFVFFFCLKISFGGALFFFFSFHLKIKDIVNLSKLLIDSCGLKPGETLAEEKEGSSFDSAETIIKLYKKKKNLLSPTSHITHSNTHTYHITCYRCFAKKKDSCYLKDFILSLSLSIEIFLLFFFCSQWKEWNFFMI